MPKKQTKRASLTNQLRTIVDTCGLSRYRIAKETGIDQASLSKFLSGERGISATALDKLGELLELDLTMHGPRVANTDSTNPQR